jgi:hypothetical protein
MPNYNPSLSRFSVGLTQNGKLLHEVFILPSFSYGDQLLECDMAHPTKILSA